MVQLGQPERRIGRRTTLAAGVAVGAVPGLLAARLGSGPFFRRDRDLLTSGARTGEVTTSSAVVWSRGVREGRLMLELRSNGRLLRSTRGQWTDARADHTARMELGSLGPGRDYEATVWFASPDGTESTRERVRFRTAPVHAAAQSFVWSGDTCGQGWGINDELGGLTTYRAILGTRPDFFIHCGDTIYGDEPMEETVLEPSGDVWRNRLTEAVTPSRRRWRTTAAGTATRCSTTTCGRCTPRCRRSRSGTTTRRPTTGTPGSCIDDERLHRARCDVLAARGRRAWQEYQPVPVRSLTDRSGNGFAPCRIYRRVPRGQHLDVFCLDMRTYRGSNPPSAGAAQPGILGPTQEAWLIDELTRSRATWKVISADLPLSIPSNRDTDLDGPSNGDDGGCRSAGSRRSPGCCRHSSATST